MKGRYQNQRWSRGHKARRQGQGQKKSEAKAKDSLSEDRHSRGQGQECSRQRPRTKDTSASALQKKKVFTKFFQAISKKKRSSQKFFKRSSRNNAFQKIFQVLHKILTIQKLVLSSSRGQSNFRGLEASRPRPRTSKCVLEDVLEAKDVLEDSTSDQNLSCLTCLPVSVKPKKLALIVKNKNRDRCSETITKLILCYFLLWRSCARLVRYYWND